jgi:hypothetical protein
MIPVELIKEFGDSGEDPRIAAKLNIRGAEYKPSLGT